MTLRSAKELLGYKVAALEDKAGRVNDIYFDDKIWVIRHIIADLRRLGSAQQVVISPQVLGQPDWETELLPVKVGLNPISRDFKDGSDDPLCPQQDLDPVKSYQWLMESDDPHLWSLADVLGYRVQTSDGEGGDLADFLLDDRSWTIRYAVVQIGTSWSGKQVSLIPQWIKRIERPDSKIWVSLSRKTLENCPEYFASFYTKQPYAVKFYQYRSDRPQLALMPAKQSSEAVYL